MLFTSTLSVLALSNIITIIFGEHFEANTKELRPVPNPNTFQQRRSRSIEPSESCSKLQESCDIPKPDEKFVYRCCPGLECKLDDGFFVCLPSKRLVVERTATAPSGECPYKQGVHLMTKPVNSNDGAQFDDQVSSIIKEREALLKSALYYGSGTTSYRRILRDINLLMRDNYKKMIKGVGDNIYPLIVASDFDPRDPVNGVGATFTLYLDDGSSKKISPTNSTYEMLKNIAHIPLGLYVIVGGYFRSPISIGWHVPLRNYQNRIYEAMRAAESKKLDLPEQQISNDLKVLRAANLHIERWFRKGAVTVEDFEAFCKEVYPVIEENLTKAAKIQAEAVVPALQKWKDELGPEWENTYFIIPTVWPVSAINPRHQAILELVTPEQARTHIIMVQNQVDLVEQRATLGRIVGDRAAALLIFGTSTEFQKELVFGLTSAQDVLSIAFERAISEVRSKSKNNKGTSEDSQWF